MNEHLEVEWYVFYIQGKDSVEIETARIAASCLGDAVMTAKLLAKHCELNLIGVAPDLGVPEG